MTVVQFPPLPPTAFEGRAVDILLQLSVLADTVTQLALEGNRSDDEWQRMHGLITLLHIVDAAITSIEAVAPTLIPDATPEAFAFFELQCALHDVRVVAFGQIRCSRLFIRDLSMHLGGGPDSLPDLLARTGS